MTTTAVGLRPAGLQHHPRRSTLVCMLFTRYTVSNVPGQDLHQLPSLMVVDDIDTVVSSRLSLPPSPYCSARHIFRCYQARQPICLPPVIDPGSTLRGISSPALLPSSEGVTVTVASFAPATSPHYLSRGFWEVHSYHQPHTALAFGLCR